MWHNSAFYTTPDGTTGGFFCTLKQRWCWFGADCGRCYSEVFTSKIFYTCPYCSQLVEVGDMFCKYCGKQLCKKYCPTCGKEIE